MEEMKLVESGVVRRSTLHRALQREGLSARQCRVPDRDDLDRFEAAAPNDLWQSDMLHGPWLPDPRNLERKRRTYLFCFLDDHSRLVPYAEFFFDEAMPRMERVLKVGMLRRGIPKAIYVDNGKVYSANQFGAACASLGIYRIRAAPYASEGKGKQERFFETLQMQLLPEVEVSNVATLAELNESFWAWLECIYHQTVHSQTGQTPLDRYHAGLETIRPAEPEFLRKAFLWRETRTVRKGGVIKLQNNTYLHDPELRGQSVELRYDPFDLSKLDLYLNDIFQGEISVQAQNRQHHPQVEHLVEPAQPKSSLDYLALLRAEYRALQQKAAGRLQFTKLPPDKEK